MSEENVEIARRAVDAYNVFMWGELTSDALAEILDPQIEMHWHDERTYPDTPQHLRGAPEFIAFAEQYRDGWADMAHELLELIEAPGDRVLVLIRQRGRGTESGVPIVIHFFELFTVRGGRLHKVEYFRHRADALEAAGLSE